MPLQGRPLDAPVDLRDVLRVGLDTGPDAVAIGSAVDRMTWRELDETSDRLARNYLALGLQPGDRLASLLPNRTYLVVHYLACIKAGLVATPLNYRYAPPEIDHALGVSGAAALVGPRRARRRPRRLRARVRAAARDHRARRSRR